jgi:hypothetical protein
MQACEKCGAPARPGDDLCRFCGSPVYDLLTDEETATLVKVFLESLDKSLKDVNGPRVLTAFAALVILPFGVFFGMRALGIGWVVISASVCFVALGGFLCVGAAVQVEQDLLFERSLKKRLSDFLAENRMEKSRLLLVAHKVMQPGSEIVKKLSKL